MGVSLTMLPVGTAEVSGEVIRDEYTLLPVDAAIHKQ